MYVCYMCKRPIVGEPDYLRSISLETGERHQLPMHEPCRKKADDFLRERGCRQVYPHEIPGR
jgi:hypothetical protein